MAQMNVSIPEKLKGWAEQRVAEGRYSSTSDYIRDLVRGDQEHEEKLRRLQWRSTRAGVGRERPRSLRVSGGAAPGLSGGGKDAA